MLIAIVLMPYITCAHRPVYLRNTPEEEEEEEEVAADEDGKSAENRYHRTMILEMMCDQCAITEHTELSHITR